MQYIKMAESSRDIRNTVTGNTHVTSPYDVDYNLIKHGTLNQDQPDESGTIEQHRYSLLEFIYQSLRKTEKY